MTIFTTGAGQKSAPHTVPRGAIVTVTPSPGASAVVESTAASAADVASNVATWSAWPNGVVAAGSSSQLAGDHIYLRVTAVGGDVVCEIDKNPTARALAPYRADWAGSGETNAAYLGTNICLLGDSIKQQESNMPGGTANYLARGEVVNALALLGQPWKFEPADNFAINGASLDDMTSNGLPLLLAANATKRYTRCFISCFTNDTNSGVLTLDQMKAKYMAAISALRSGGIIPVQTSVRPRGSAATPGNLDGKKQNAHLNAWLYQLSLTGIIEFIDLTPAYADTTSTDGNAATGLMYDVNLHPNMRGAFFAALIIADYYKSRGVSPAVKFATSQNDVFDRTNNPSGIAFNGANPLMLGDVSGVPTGMTATPGGAWSKSNRTLPNGQVRSDPLCTLTANATHRLSDDWTAAGAWSATQLQAGDVMEGWAKLTFTGSCNLKCVSLQMSEGNGATVDAHIALTGNDPEVLPIPDGQSMWIKTPRVTIRPYGGSGNAVVLLRLDLITAATGTPTGTVRVEAFELRKVA